MSFIISFNKQVNVSVSLSSGIWFSKLIKPKKEVIGTFQSVAGWSEAQVIAWGFQLASEVGVGAVL